MSNIHTLSDINNRAENKEALPRSWADSRPVALDDQESGLYGATTRMQMGYIDMNGEQQTAPGGSMAHNCLYGCAPCCIEPCGVQRRSEYVKSLKSLSVPLALLQVLMFIISLAIGGMVSPKQNPLFGPPATTLVKLGAKQGYLIQRGQVWRFLTPILLHGGILHLLMNMLCQWRFGLFIERRWGTLKFAAVYLAAGFGASLLSCLWSPNRIAVGASGSLMGIMGGFLADILLNWHNIPATQRNMLLIQTGTWAGIGLLLGFAPMVDGGAHFGGILVGFAVGIIVNSHIPKEQRNRILAMVIPSVILGIFVLVGTICFFTVVKTVPYP